MPVMTEYFFDPRTPADDRIATLMRKRVRGYVTTNEQVELENLLADRSRERRQDLFASPATDPGEAA